ncbi:MAG: glycosyltransferase [bacterium]
MPPIDITVVIVSYNVRPFLDHCLQSIKRAAEGLSLQIIVVDNASTDSSAEMIEQRYPEVELISNRENVGFGRANNQAFERSQGEAVLILNPDSFVQEDTLRSLWKRFCQSNDVGAIGPKIIQPDGTFEPRSMRGFPTPWAAFSFLSGLSALFPRRKLFNRYLLTYLDPNQEHDVDALSGCCMMVRRSLLRELKGFDPDYFMYGEDLDLCYRIRKAGYRILYYPATRIVHFKGESTRRSNLDREYHFQRAMELFVQKNLVGNISFVARFLIKLGFSFRSIERRLAVLFAPLLVPAVDLLLLSVLIYFGRWIRFGDPSLTPNVLLASGIYSLFYVLSGINSGAYGASKFSSQKALLTALIAGGFSGAFTYFFQQWAFSRFVVLFFASGMCLAMPLWRKLFRFAVQRKTSPSSHLLLRRAALIIGTDAQGREIVRRIRSQPVRDLEPVGFIAFDQEEIGEIIEDVPVLGSVEELARIIQTETVQDLVFSSSSISYEEIIELIHRHKHRKLNFEVAPSQNHAQTEDLPYLRLELSSPQRGFSRSARKKQRVFFP